MYEFSEGMIVNITRVWDVKLNAHDVIMICGVIMLDMTHVGCGI